MFRDLLITCVIFSVCCVFKTQGQSVFNGRVLENKTRILLSGVKVENLSNKFKTIAGNDGRFSIAAKIGDLLTLKGFSYRTDTLLITDMHDREIFLELETNVLNQVNITNNSGRSSSADKNITLPYDPEFHGQTAVYSRDKDGNFNGGLNLRLHYWKGDDHSKSKARQLEMDREVIGHISTLFTADNIGKYVPLKGEDLDDFLLLYIPDVRTYTGNNFNLINYLNTSYKEFLKLSAEQRKGGHIFKNHN